MHNLKNNIKISDLDFVCETYNSKTKQLNFSKNIFWNFVKKANESGFEITIKYGAYNADFNFDISGEQESLKAFLIKNYLGGDAEQWSDIAE